MLGYFFFRWHQRSYWLWHSYSRVFESRNFCRFSIFFVKNEFFVAGLLRPVSLGGSLSFPIGDTEKKNFGILNHFFFWCKVFWSLNLAVQQLLNIFWFDSETKNMSFSCRIYSAVYEWPEPVSFSFWHLVSLLFCIKGDNSLIWGVKFFSVFLNGHAMSTSLIAFSRLSIFPQNFFLARRFWDGKNVD